MTAGGHPVFPNPVAPLSPVEKPAAVRCLGPVDAAGLAAQVDRLSEEAWRREDGRVGWGWSWLRCFVYRMLEYKLRELQRKRSLAPDADWPANRSGRPRVAQRGPIRPRQVALD